LAANFKVWKEMRGLIQVKKLERSSGSRSFFFNRGWIKDKFIVSWNTHEIKERLSISVMGEAKPV
jgi:predicted 3-demethylubiquinone-9 3-methyltransferase (glyoxalase superfamily)